MGNILTKCCVKKNSKYKKDTNEKIVHLQNNDSNVPVVTNQRNTLATSKTSPQKIDLLAAGKDIRQPLEQQPKKDFDKDRIEDGSKPNMRKSKRPPANRKETDSDESTSNSSSPSESDIGETTPHTHIKKKDSKGTTTIITKKTKTVSNGDSHILIENVENMVINMGNGAPTNKTKKSDFILMNEPVRVAQRKIEASKSICAIYYPNGQATGFRVGTKYIMTALHVVKAITEGCSSIIGINTESTFKLRSDVYAEFNFLDNRCENERFYFEDEVHLCHEETDTAILSLKEKKDLPMPQPFTYFGTPEIFETFHFIGHPSGNAKCVGHSKYASMNYETFQEDVKSLIKKSDEHTKAVYGHAKPFDVGPHNVLTNPDRFLFRCTFGCMDRVLRDLWFWQIIM